MDEITFQSFYQKTAPALRSYIRMICNDSAMADDLLQETFYRFLHVGLSGMNEFQMKAYLYKTAISLVSDHWRKMNRQQRWFEKTIPPEKTMPDPNMTHDMQRLLRELNPRQQALLWLAYVEGLDHREIASSLGMKEKSVRVLLVRARRKLAGILKEKGFGPKETS